MSDIVAYWMVICTFFFFPFSLVITIVFVILYTKESKEKKRLKLEMQENLDIENAEILKDIENENLRLKENDTVSKQTINELQNTIDILTEEQRENENKENTYKQKVGELERKIDTLTNEIREKEKKIKSVNNNYTHENIPDFEKEFILTTGRYKGNVDILVGIYDVEIIDGRGCVETNKPEDTWFYMDSDEKSRKEYNRIDLYRNLEITEKTTLKISGDAKIKFSLSRKYDFSHEIKELKREYEVEKRMAEAEISTLKREIEILNNDCIDKYYKFSSYEKITSQDCKNQLILLKQEEKEMRNNEKDIKVQYREDKKFRTKLIRQMLRTFNAECDNITMDISLKNIDTAKRKIQQSYDTINQLYLGNGLYLTKDLLNLKLEQASLLYTYELKYQQEKEIQRAIKEQMVEEARAERELEEQKKKIEKDMQQHLGEINRLMKYIQKTQQDAERQLYMDKIKELEEKIKSLEADKEQVTERQANAKAGYVYIISNIGSFGDDVYKIGMTRRLEPMDRIHELSSASVPFEFDVHAMIFSSDAPELENMLHKHFADRAVNKVNTRKEFYRVNIDEIEEVVKRDYNETVQFTKVPIAAEYWQSVNIK